MSEPTDYSRRILLAVTGLSPQVVTETLYALAIKRTPPFIPTEIHLITTREGAERARLSLLSESPGGFHSLLRDYGLPAIAFDEGSIHVLQDHNGADLDDIRSLEDNRWAADLITATLRELTADPNSAVHVSIAGGRKTMGFLLGYALTLFGRPQDKLSHVLVSTPFESSYQFFYPTPYSRVIEVANRQLADTATACVTLAEIPYVSLRHGLPEALLRGEATYNDTVEAARLSLGPPSLAIDLLQRLVTTGGKCFRIPPAQLAMLMVFVRRRLEGLPPIGAPSKGIADRKWGETYLAELRRIAGPMGDIDAAERALHHGMDGEYFSTALSRLRDTLKKKLCSAAVPYLVDDGASRPRKYSLAVPASAIVLVE